MVKLKSKYSLYTSPPRDAAQANWHFLYPLSFVGTWIVYLRWMEQRTSWRNVGSPSLFPTLYLPSPTTCADCRLELQKKVREHFKFTQKATTRAFSWLKVPTSAFTFKTLLRLCCIGIDPTVIVQLRRLIVCSTTRDQSRSPQPKSHWDFPVIFHLPSDNLGSRCDIQIRHKVSEDYSNL